MKNVIPVLIVLFQAYGVLTAQGYLRNDAVLTHPSGITINEVSAFSNPVDYNADGTVDGGDKDEFIELVNSSDQAINIHNWTIATGREDDMDLFTFPDTTILPGKALVLFCRNPSSILNFNPGPGNIVLSAGDNSFRLANINPEAVALKNTHNLYITVHWNEGVVNSGFLSSNPTLAGEDVALDDNWYPGQSQSRIPDYNGTWSQHPTIYGTINWSNNDTTVLLTDPQASPGRRIDGGSPLAVGVILGSVDLTDTMDDSGVSVYLDGVINDTTVTDSDGYYQFNYLEDGTYSITVSCTGYWNPDSTIDNIAVDADTVTESVLPLDPIVSDLAALDSRSIPVTFGLGQNYPNPFNPLTRIRYRLPESSTVRFEIFNMLGKRVAVLVDTDQPAGYYTVTWDARDDQGNRLASGLYFYRLQAGTFTQHHKMVLLK